MELLPGTWDVSQLSSILWLTFSFCSSRMFPPFPDADYAFVNSGNRLFLESPDPQILAQYSVLVVSIPQRNPISRYEHGMTTVYEVAGKA